MQNPTVEGMTYLSSATHEGLQMAPAAPPRRKSLRGHGGKTWNRLSERQGNHRLPLSSKPEGDDVSVAVGEAGRIS